ncbi:hypothetical protein P3102_07405 [Amycolatopsis sp. QT-25]|uniref:hypothetical protein n=1 Tax=Amycolatopsis sp. QT-25 TaxID=3034022 RepID=UPI0023EB60D0|nr:hypothetical protein [Amycolatopsis sp. QT-25]WET81049.1 hypothetical protein P3102_07405 [Amycolatopsis sp. QT-25]
MSPEYQYYAISIRGNDLGLGPTQICRRWVDEDGRHDEVYTKAASWSATSELIEAESGQFETEARAISARLALSLVEIQSGRGVSYEPSDGRYSYFAWLADDKSSLDDARQVIRTWKSPQGYSMEESYTFDSGWERSYLYQDVRDARKSGWLMSITEEDVERFKEIVAERRS